MLNVSSYRGIGVYIIRILIDLFLLLYIFFLFWAVSRIRQSDPNVTVPTYLPLDSLQKKLKDLEAENISLRSEVEHAHTHAQTLMHAHTQITG